ncbi:holo-[acyl-carrier protein] synthase [Ectothiorhodosinus mongolicus]|uniref:Holo-[acyl-carrier-protein] synthase n=1 Tax=Ectothiorhodosinus mongolicus TaxID=233100 RepID=A0A1R3VRY6_9GAMM|nr:holo-ACP synthase [Ectothiorhodosinus mongolicus]ULX56375.1 holo-ACP synthase [Ectothiorhodosinus mongolicus]SIT65892.1 holo-[acyl-carrier protein] synthase [Ectothiorhodosinus mongolicus]
MPIIGIGTDLVRIERIERALERHGERFAQRILHPQEYAQWQESAQPAALLAKRFAAKEALAKALGVGIGAQLSLHDICVTHSELGRPELALSGAGAATAARLGVTRLHLSLSDEADHALAFVVAE